jgi:hypothetical protein
MGLGGIDEEVGKEEMEQDNITNISDRKPKRRPFHYWEVRDTTYKLKLITATIERLENKYRTNLVNLVGNDGIPPLSVMLTITQQAMVTWHHGITYQDVKKLYDSWTEDGGNQMDFFTKIIMPTMAVSGFFTEKQAESMMESLQEMDEIV